MLSLHSSLVVAVIDRQEPLKNSILSCSVSKIKINPDGKCEAWTDESDDCWNSSNSAKIFLFFVEWVLDLPVSVYKMCSGQWLCVAVCVELTAKPLLGFIAKRDVRGMLNLAVCFTPFLSTQTFQDTLHQTAELFAVNDGFSS